jgi:hypothetical protein
MREQYDTRNTILFVTFLLLTMLLLRHSAQRENRVEEERNNSQIVSLKAKNCDNKKIWQGTDIL